MPTTSQPHSEQQIETNNLNLASSGLKTSPEADSNVMQEIAQILRSNCSEQDSHRQTFRLIAAHFSSNYAQLNVHAGTVSTQDEYQSGDACTEDVLAVVEAMSAEAEAEERSSVRLFPKDTDASTAVLSSPVYSGAAHVGSICMAITTSADTEPRVLLSELVALVAFAGAQKSIDSELDNRSNQSTGIHRALEKAARYDSLRDLASSMVTNIAAKFACDQVAFGFVFGHGVKLIATSGSKRLSSGRSANVIVQAMKECVHAKNSIHFQSSEAMGESRLAERFPRHRKWHEGSECASLLSVPLVMDDGRMVAIVSLQRDAAQPFTTSEIARIRGMLRPFSTVVHLLERASRNVVTRLRESVRSCFRSLRAPKQRGRRICAVALTTAALCFAFGWTHHWVDVPCQVQPAAVRQLSAPFEGKLQEVLVHDGDAVNQGQAIARFDTVPLKVELDRLQSEVAALRIEMDNAVSRRDVATAAMAATSIEAAETELTLIEDRIAKATIVAPVDGVVLGSLDQRVDRFVTSGAPLVGIGAPEDLRLELHIPEDQARFIEVGQAGSFATVGQPERSMQFEVEHIAPRSTLVNDKSVVVAVADFEDAPAQKNWGRRGTAKIDAGWRPIWSVATRRVIGRFRKTFGN